MLTCFYILLEYERIFWLSVYACMCVIRNDFCKLSEHIFYSLFQLSQLFYTSPIASW